MKIAKYIVMGIYAIICVVLIILILKQNKDDSGASGTIVGASANNFYEKNKGKRRKNEKSNNNFNDCFCYFNSSIRNFTCSLEFYIKLWAVLLLILLF